MDCLRPSQVTGIAQFSWLASAMFIGAMLLLTAPTGCDLDLSDFNLPGDSNTDTNGMSGEPQDLPGPTVDVRFVNQTDQAVLADVFVSTNGDLSPETIFAAGNQLTEGVGLASTGVLVPQSTDAVEVACVADMVVATTGGVFRDPDTGEDLGTGPSRILQEGLVFDCGAEITFVYRMVDDAFTVVVTLN